MDNECYEQGQCKICHCETTALQMANKACDKPCYPVMMNKKLWKLFSMGWLLDSGGYVWKMEKDLSLTKKKL